MCVFACGYNDVSSAVFTVCGVVFFIISSQIRERYRSRFDMRFYVRQNAYM